MNIRTLSISELHSCFGSVGGGLSEKEEGIPISYCIISYIDCHTIVTVEIKAREKKQ